MAKIKKITGISLFVVLISCMTKNDSDKGKPVDSVLFYRNQRDSLKMELLRMEEQIDFIEDELRMRESEISYWGHKYDSCMSR